jgi:hypothetical protein
MHHHMSNSRKHYQDAFSFEKRSPHDPATKVTVKLFNLCESVLMVSQGFVKKLKDHLLGRLLGREYNGDENDFSDADRNTVHLVNNRIYSAKVLRVNFTTYDVRRDQDSMNPRTHCDVMVQSHEDTTNAHPFWYARVLGVFHAEVFHTGRHATNRAKQHMEFLWVRWFGIVEGHRYGAKASRLPKIGFIQDTDETAFGFLDPSLVIRACHLIPAFADGRTQELLTIPTSVGRPIGETDDWVAFYVMMYVILWPLLHPLVKLPSSFADRDMYMRYLGGGVGHIDSTDRGHDSKDDDIEMQDECEREHNIDRPGGLDEVHDSTGNSDGSDGSDGETSGTEGEHNYSDDSDLGPDDGEGEGDDDSDYGYSAF